MSEDYTVFFTGANPAKLRLHLLDPDPSLATIIKIYYQKSSRLMVNKTLGFLFICLPVCTFKYVMTCTVALL
jgi:hypothetical protein